MSENMIRLILLLIGSIIILAILWDGLRRKKDRYAQPQIVEDFFSIHTPETISESVDDDEEIKESFEDTEEEIQIEENIVDPNQVSEIETPPENSTIKRSLKKPDFVSVRLIATKDKQFAGYPLLRAILANNFDFGEKKLFHRYADQDKQARLFSLASLSPPGDFDLYTIGNYVCDGLILYMNPNELSDPLNTFHQMLDAARNLAHTLKGELMSGANRPWTEETAKEIELLLTD